MSSINLFHPSSELAIRDWLSISQYIVLRILPVYAAVNIDELDADSDDHCAIRILRRVRLVYIVCYAVYYEVDLKLKKKGGMIMQDI